MRSWGLPCGKIRQPSSSATQCAAPAAPQARCPTKDEYLPKGGDPCRGMSRRGGTPDQSKTPSHSPSPLLRASDSLLRCLFSTCSYSAAICGQNTRGRRNSRPSQKCNPSKMPLQRSLPRRCTRALRECCEPRAYFWHPRPYFRRALPLPLTLGALRRCSTCNHSPAERGVWRCRKYDHLLYYIRYSGRSAQNGYLQARRVLELQSSLFRYFGFGKDNEYFLDFLTSLKDVIQSKKNYGEG